MATRAPTLLERHLAGDAARATPRDAFELARRAFEAGERVDMHAIATELGVSRTTLYRWVGSKELLIGEVLWAREAATLERVIAAAGERRDRVAFVLERSTRLIARDRALARFLERDPEFALRVLTTKESRVQRRTVAALVDLLGEDVSAGRLAPAMDLHTLAYVLVRIAESFLYSDVITGDEADLDKAVDAFRAVLGT
jgi:AcrR family transcriptional regulator